MLHDGPAQLAAELDHRQAVDVRSRVTLIGFDAEQLDAVRALDPVTRLAAAQPAAAAPPSCSHIEPMLSSRSKCTPFGGMQLGPCTHVAHGSLAVPR